MNVMIRLPTNTKNTQTFLRLSHLVYFVCFVGWVVTMILRKNRLIEKFLFQEMIIMKKEKYLKLPLFVKLLVRLLKKSWFPLVLITILSGLSCQNQVHKFEIGRKDFFWSRENQWWLKAVSCTLPEFHENTGSNGCRCARRWGWIVTGHRSKN